MEKALFHPNGPQQTIPQHLLMSRFLGNNGGCSSVTGTAKTKTEMLIFPSHVPHKTDGIKGR